MRPVLAVVAAWVASSGVALGDASQVGYVDSSTGLETPAMEGGRTEMELGDVNGDGHVDLASIGDHGSPFINTSEHGLMVWFGDGDGGWSVFQYGDFGYGGVALGDVNGDGLMDVAYGMHHNYSGEDLGDQLLEVALGDGSGQSWAAWDDGLAVNGETWGMFGTDFADVDNDGDLDVGSISFGCCAGLHVYRNNGDGTWTQTFGFVGGNSSMDFVFGDVNGDGLADFAASHGNGTVYIGDGDGGFAPADGNLPAPVWRTGVSLGDVNNDGRDDVAFVTGSDGLAVWSWVSPGVWQNLSGALPTSGTFDATQIADMDLDGNADVLGFRAGSVVIYGADGAGQWAEIANVAVPDSCGYAAFRAGVDADHNGLPDFVTIAEEACEPWSGGRNRPRYYKESSAPVEATIHPKSPGGRRSWYAGSVQFIEWHAGVPGSPQTTATVDIDLSVSGSAGPWMAVASGEPNNGRYQWTVPTDVPSSTNCHVRYTLNAPGPAATAITPGPFTILGGSAVAISAVVSTADHGPAGVIGIDIDIEGSLNGDSGDVTTEPRAPGVRELRVTFTAALDPSAGGLNEAAVDVTSTPPGAPIPTITTALADDNHTLVLTFAEALPDEHVYRMEITDEVVVTTADVDFEVRALRGNVANDPGGGPQIVNAVDLGLSQGVRGQFLPPGVLVDEGNARYDVDVDGTINAADLSYVRLTGGVFGNSAP